MDNASFVARSHTTEMDQKISALTLGPEMADLWSQVNKDGDKNHLSTAELIAAEGSTSFSHEQRKMIHFVRENSDLICMLNNSRDKEITKEDLANLWTAKLDWDIATRTNASGKQADSGQIDIESKVKSRVVVDSMREGSDNGGLTAAALGALFGTCAGLPEGPLGMLAGRAICGAAFGVLGAVAGGTTGFVTGLFKADTKYRDEYRPRLECMFQRLGY